MLIIINGHFYWLLLLSYKILDEKDMYYRIKIHE